MLDNAGRADHRLGRRRGAGARVDPRRRHPDPPDRRGRRARHVQPPPRRLPRRGHRRASTSRCSALPQAQAGVRDPQQPAHRERHDRLRVRLQRAGAGPAGDLGSAVRRLHQRRAGRSSTSSSPRAAPSGARRRRWCCCCRTATKARARITRARARSASSSAAADINLRIANCTTAAQYFHLLRRQALLLHDRPAAADRADAEEPAAPSAGGLAAARAGRRRAGSR